MHDGGERDSERDGNDGAQRVNEQFPPRPDRPDVVPYRHQQDRQHAEPQTSRQVERQFPAACGEPLRATEHEGDRCDDREPAKAGNRPIVDLARVGDVHRPHRTASRATSGVNPNARAAATSAGRMNQKTSVT